MSEFVLVVSHIVVSVCKRKIRRNNSKPQCYKPHSFDLWQL